MYRRLLFSLVLILFFIASAHFCATNASEKPPAADKTGSGSLDRVKWMAGYWVGEYEGTKMEECWMEPSGGIMLGLHRDVKESRARFFEFLRIESTPEGIIYYANPGGGATTPFRRVNDEEKRAVFENMEHDYPQRIIYRLDEKDTLHVRVEGNVRGKMEYEEWIWHREKPGTDQEKPGQTGAL